MTGTVRRPVVVVIGAADATQEELATAERVGQMLAEREVIVACGGRGGVMEAVCRGAASRDGMTIGLLPGSDAGDGNAFLTIALPTGLGQARNAILALAGRAVIAIGGGAGTLSEIGLALKAGRRVIGLGTWDLRDSHGAPAQVIVASSPEHAVRLALEGKSIDPHGGT